MCGCAQDEKTRKNLARIKRTIMPSKHFMRHCYYAHGIMKKTFGALLFKVIQMPVSKYYQTKYHYVVAVTDGLDSRICLFVFFSLLSYIVAKPSKKLQSFTLAILQE